MTSQHQDQSQVTSLQAERTPLISSHYSHDDVTRPRQTTFSDVTDIRVQKKSLCCSYRMVIILCCMTTLCVTFATQASMSAAFVCMLEDVDTYNDTLIYDVTTANNTDVMNSSSHIFSACEHDTSWRFSLSKTTQGWVLSSLFIGYYIAQLPSGLAATRYGPKRVMTISLLLVCLLQLATVPAVLSEVLPFLITVRVLTGLAIGFLYAPTFALVANWAPKQEISLLVGIAGMGMEFGLVLSYGMSAVACEMTYFQGGWPIVFYAQAVMCLLTLVLFLFFVSDSPHDNKNISEAELQYIANFVPDVRDKSRMRLPVRQIVTSAPVWACILSKAGSDWLYFLLIAMSPTYIKEILHLSNMQVNILSGVPCLGILPSIYLAGYLCDKVIASGRLSRATVRKISDAITKLGNAAAVIGVAYLPEGDAVSDFILNLIAAAFLGFGYTSWMANRMELAPAYTGFIVGLSQLGAVWVSFVVPIFFEALTPNQSRAEWQMAFFISTGFVVFTLIFYIIYASTDLQPWAMEVKGYCVLQEEGSLDKDGSLRQKTQSFNNEKEATSASVAHNIAENKKTSRSNSVVEELLVNLAASLNASIEVTPHLRLLTDLDPANIAQPTAARSFSIGSKTDESTVD